MGAWGTGLYQDDTTCDIKDEYITYLQIGMTNEEATKKVIEENEWCFEDEEEGALLWFALADTQWKYGRLIDEVKQKAIECIDSGIDLEKWKEEDEKLCEKRKKVLEALKEKLNSEQPPEKKVTKMKFFRAHWKVGDILSYQILNEKLKNHKWYGKYILLKVVCMYRTNIGSLPKDIYYNEHDMISLYNWIGDKKPDLELIKNLKIIPFSEYDDMVFGKTTDMVATVLLSKKEFKKLNIEVIGREESNIQKRYSLPVGYNKYNFDDRIIRALEREKKKGNLIEDIE